MVAGKKIVGERSTLVINGPWQVAGSYFEVCNCDAICPCRRIGGIMGGDSTYGICDFALSWHIKKGRIADADLSNRRVVLAGTYSDNDPGQLWHVILYVDERCERVQREALEDIFLGRVKGTPLRNFAHVITEVYSIRSARIELSHVKNKEYIKVGNMISARTDRPFPDDVEVACAIPGLDQPGQEIIAQHFRVRDSPFDWDFTGRCGFATKFDYKSD